MALGAGHALVKVSQGIASFVVIELEDATQGLPRSQGVTVLAGHVQGAMGAASHTARGCLISLGLADGQKKDTQQDA